MKNQKVFNLQEGMRLHAANAAMMMAEEATKAVEGSRNINIARDRVAKLKTTFELDAERHGFTFPDRLSFSEQIALSAVFGLLFAVILFTIWTYAGI